ncbi:MAG: hypothetical protein K2X43_10330 [Hyphomonadaceae bacterium]|jgi:Flp pilus assembly protein TadG|nr:hypothetical protein [Hyphomonadaceae bacterium]
MFASFLFKIGRAAAVGRGIMPRLRRDRSGNVGMMFTLLVVPLTGAIGLAVDMGRVYSIAMHTQSALDAAALAAGRVAQVEKTDTLPKANKAASAYFDQAKPADVVESNLAFSPNAQQTAFTVTATSWVKTPFLSVLNVISYKNSAEDAPNACKGNYYACTKVSTTATAQICLNCSDTGVGNADEGTNLEIALMLDVTGSMAGQKIQDLKAAAKDLVDIVVWGDQSKYYSKVAIVPYANAVNLGGYADKARGPVKGPKTITGATRASPVVITAKDHGLANGETVYITGVNGMTQINNKEFTVANATANTFALSGINGKNYSSYTSGGSAYCTLLGCTYFKFKNPSGQNRLFQVSTCVSERPGANAFNDTAPSSTLLGYNYPAPSNPCLANTVVPLNKDRTALKAEIDALQASGSTGGHLGVAWGWYLLSPNFGSLWPTESQPAAYGAARVKKIAVLMTDGEYNSAYCSGVISQDSTQGSGSASDHINCNAPNGHAFSQALSLCANTKAAGVTVYTVGFNVVDDQRAKDLMTQCATSATHVYLVSGGDALKAAFRDIALKISNLRLTN